MLADGQRIFRDGLRKVLEADGGFDVVADAGTADDALRLTCELSPDILLLEVSLPGRSGLEVLRELAGRSATRAILLTDTIAQDKLLAAFRLGARGVVMKSATTSVLLEGIRQVLAGHYWIRKQANCSLVHARRQLAADSRRRRRGPFGLSQRELEVIAGILASRTNKDIAARLLVSESTVKHHLSNIFDKVGVSTRLELALFAQHHGLLSPRVTRRAS